MDREITVASSHDLKEGQVREAAEGHILLWRRQGQLFALGAHCPHYSARLAEGAVCGSRVRCPWHQSEFDLATGDLLEPPAFDGLRQFRVREEGGWIKVLLPEGLAEQRAMPLYEGPVDLRAGTIAILGAGAAGAAAAEMLRQRGFTGKVVLITRENHLPYDRPPLSKSYLRNEDEDEPPYLRPAEFYQSCHIDFLMGQEVTSVDLAAHRLTFAAREPLHYDKILLAPGGVPRRLNIPGMDLPGVFTLRSLDDCRRLRAAAAAASQIAIVGAGFIGMEAAAAFRGRDLPVTVISPEKLPLEKTLGRQVGTVLRGLHEEQGVQFRLGAEVAAFSGEERVRAVRLQSGEELRADLVLVARGIDPATGIIQGIALNADGSVSVDDRLRVTGEAWAAGDIAYFPDARSGRRIRVEHWRLAQQHGRAAARNMMGEDVPFAGLPFFWTNHYKTSVRYNGYARQWDEVIVHGNPQEHKFMALYVWEGRVAALAGMKMDQQIAAAAELMYQDVFPRPEELRGGYDFLARLPQVC